MYIGNVNFGKKYVFGASGVMNLDGSGWPHHRILKWFLRSYRFQDVVKLMKTTTIEDRTETGNLPLKEGTFEPKERKPKCIAIDFVRAEVVNSVGLTNPGFEYMLTSGAWKKVDEDFIISIMLLGTEEEQIAQACEVAELLSTYGPSVPHLVGIELNVTCPNTGHTIDLGKSVRHYHRVLDILQAINLFITIKVNLETSVDTAYELATHPAAKGIVLPNTTKWGSTLVPINWDETFPKAHNNGLWRVNSVPLSPLYGIEVNGHSIGDGGLSTPRVFPLVLDFVRNLRQRKGYTGAVIASAIYHKRNVRPAFEAGVDAIGLGAVTIVRPFNVGGIIREANQLGPQFDRGERKTKR